MSANGNFSDISSFNINHGQLVSSEEAIVDILERLNLDGTKVIAEDISGIDFEDVLIIMLRSPGKIMVTTDTQAIDGGIDAEGEYVVDSLNKLILIPGYSGHKFSVNVLDNNESGEYELLVGYMNGDNDMWIKVNGSISGGDADSYDFRIEDSTLQTDWEGSIEDIKENILELVNKLDSDSSWRFFWRKLWLKRYLVQIKRTIDSIESANPRVDLRRLRLTMYMLLELRNRTQMTDSERLSVIDQIYGDVESISVNIASKVTASPKIVKAYKKMADYRARTLEHRLKNKEDERRLEYYLRAKQSYDLAENLESLNPQGAVEMYYSGNLWNNNGLRFH